MSPRVIVILGPTAGGKSDLAMGLARQLGGELVSADSMQVYRGMDIGTAKPTAAERAEIPHHAIDLVDAGEEGFTVAQWLVIADAAVEDILARGKTPIVVGGTNLYIRAFRRPRRGPRRGSCVSRGTRADRERRTPRTACGE